jgi:hypothetical protein
VKDYLANVGKWTVVIVVAIVIAGTALGLTACSTGSTPAPKSVATHAATGAAPKTDPACAQWTAVQNDVGTVANSGQSRVAESEVKGLESLTTDLNLKTYLSDVAFQLSLYAVDYDAGTDTTQATGNIAEAANSVSGYCVH